MWIQKPESLLQLLFYSLHLQKIATFLLEPKYKILLEMSISILISFITFYMVSKKP